MKDKFYGSEVIIMAQYVISDGKGRYLKSDYRNHYTITSNIVLADRFSRIDADRVYKNYVPKKMRKDFHIEIYELPSAKEVKETKKVIPVTMKEIETNSIKAINDPEIQRWLDKVTSFNGLVKEATVRRETLNNKLSDIDQEITDIMHFIEWKKLNAAQMCKACKMLKERREKRRKIKNELKVVTYITECTTRTTMEEDLHKIIDTLDNRKYEPRKMTELYSL